MFRTFVNTVVDHASQLALLSCVGIPFVSLDWLAAKLPSKVW